MQWDFSNPDNRAGCKLVAWSTEKKLQFPVHRPFRQCQSEQPEPTTKGPAACMPTSMTGPHLFIQQVMSSAALNQLKVGTRGIGKGTGQHDRIGS